MKPIKIVVLLWDVNDHTFSFSRMYDETWVEKIYRGFKRNLTRPFEFICFTDREREFEHPEIQQRRLRERYPRYEALLEPYEMNEPMILVGLDTIITGNCDHLVDYCFEDQDIGLPRDPYFPDVPCMGAVLTPAGKRFIWDNWKGEDNMDWIREQPHRVLDDIWPGHVVSYKGHTKSQGLGDTRIVYFHGEEKAHQIGWKEPWIAQHWI